MSTSMTLNDLEFPVIFSDFFVMLSCDTHFKSKLRQNG